MEEEILKDIWPEWKIIDKIGKGAFGTVYKAVRGDHQVESSAAIKVISISQDDPGMDSIIGEGVSAHTYIKEIVKEFVNEIQLMESFKGVQNIVSVEDYQVVENKEKTGWKIFIRMELLTPLNEYIQDKTFNEQEVIRLGCDICQALELCAKKNVIHRDIKPENIFVNDFESYKLGDFGIARKLENITAGLSQKGTYNYMAPEVERGTRYDVTADIYSLGLVLYRFLNRNRLPFLETEEQMANPSQRMTALRRRLDGELLPPPSEASPEMQEVVLRACNPDPSKRFKSAKAMKEALLAVRDGTYQKTMVVRKPPVDDTPSSEKKSLFKRKRTLGIAIAGVAIAVIIAIGSIGGLIYSQVISEDQKEDNKTKNQDTASVPEESNGTETEGTREQRESEESNIVSDIEAKGEKVVFHRQDREDYEQVTITGFSQQGVEVWNYTTDKYMKTELERITEIGQYNDRYYLAEAGTLHVFNVPDGSTLWTNSDFQGTATDYVFGEDGSLYICGYYGPDLFAVGPGGNTLNRTSSFSNEYQRPYQITLGEGQLAITYETAPATNNIVYINLSDYSSSIPEVEETKDVEEFIPSTASVSMAAVTGVSATSYMVEEQYGYNHGPSNAIDGDLATAWVEDTDGQGKGESITLQLDGIYKVSGFVINAGYQKNEDIYLKNSRPYSLLVTFSDGSSQEVYLEDTNSAQNVPFDFSTDTSSVTFTLQSVYAGNKYEDTAISEISLY